MNAAALVVCGGRGRAPVLDDGQPRGVEAVVYKDLTSAQLAIALHADLLVLLTGVPNVVRNFGTPQTEPLRHLEDLLGLEFAAGSMGPKIEACRRFAEATGFPAAIGSQTDVEAILAGAAGTSVMTREHFAGRAL